MKNVFRKCVNAQIVEPFLVGVVTMLVLEFIIYPGLTMKNTVLNMVAGSFGIGIIIFIINYVRLRYFVKDKSEDTVCETIISSGETELDYISVEEIDIIKKKTRKKKEAHIQDKPKMNTKKK